MFEVLLLLGLVALVGLASRWVFEHTRIPETAILLLVGLALGPLGLITYFGLPRIDPAYFESVTPVLGAAVITFLVFDAGFRLNAKALSASMPFALPFALANVVLCIALLAAILRLGLGWGLGASLLLAAVLGGPSLAAMRSILPFVRSSDYTRNVLYLEGTLATLVTAIIAITMMQYGSLATRDYSELLRTVAASFSVSLMLGLVLGLLILWAMAHFKIKKFGYLMTFATLLVLYFIDFNVLGGIGILSIAVIGFVLGNAPAMLRLFTKKVSFEVEESFSSLQNEMGLFISTFFFVYLGLIFRPEGLTAANLSYAGLLLLGILLARLLAVLAARKLGHAQHQEDLLLASMMPRDLLSATLAAFVVAFPAFARFDMEPILLVIASTTILTSLGVNLYEAKLRNAFTFRRELTLKDGRTVLVRSFARDDIGKVGKFLNEMVKEGALIALDQKLSQSEEKESGLQSLARINRGELLLWVGEHEGRIVARAVAEKMPRRERDNVALSLYVAKEFRGVGLGSRLLRLLITEARRMFRPHNLYLTVYSNNQRAIRLYQREGFAKVGVLPGWMRHENRYLDRVFMVYKGKR